MKILLNKRTQEELQLHNNEFEANKRSRLSAQYGLHGTQQLGANDLGRRGLPDWKIQTSESSIRTT